MDLMSGLGGGIGGPQMFSGGPSSENPICGGGGGGGGVLLPYQVRFFLYRDAETEYDGEFAIYLPGVAFYSYGRPIPFTNDLEDLLPVDFRDMNESGWKLCPLQETGTLYLNVRAYYADGDSNAAQPGGGDTQVQPVYNNFTVTATLSGQADEASLLEETGGDKLYHQRTSIPVAGLNGATHAVVNYVAGTIAVQWPQHDLIVPDLESEDIVDLRTSIPDGAVMQVLKANRFSDGYVDMRANVGIAGAGGITVSSRTTAEGFPYFEIRGDGSGSGGGQSEEDHGSTIEGAEGSGIVVNDGSEADADKEIDLVGRDTENDVFGVHDFIFCDPDTCPQGKTIDDSTLFQKRIFSTGDVVVGGYSTPPNADLEVSTHPVYDKVSHQLKHVPLLLRFRKGLLTAVSYKVQGSSHEELIAQAEPETVQVIKVSTSG